MGSWKGWRRRWRKAAGAGRTKSRYHDSISRLDPSDSLYAGQTLLPGVSVPSSTSASSAAVASSSRGTQKVAPQKLVRTDPAARTLDALLPQASESQRASQRISKRRRTSEGTDGDPMQIDSDDDGSGRDGAVMIPESSGTPLPPNVKESACSLTSVRTLRKRVREAKHAGASTIMLTS